MVAIIYAIVWTFENPEKIEKIKSEFKKNEKVETSNFNYSPIISCKFFYINSYKF